MRRVLVLGRGGAGKSTFARRLGMLLGIPAVELDAVFWRAGLEATPRGEWVARQRELVAAPAWILDGDLGPYDVLEVRLAEADTVVLLNFSFARCAWRAGRRSRERWDFWVWLVSYRWRYLPRLRRLAGGKLIELRTPRAVERFLAQAQRGDGVVEPGGAEAGRGEVAGRVADEDVEDREVGQ